MSKKREEILHTVIEKMVNIIKCSHSKQGFPFGEYILSRQQVMILFFISKKKEGVSSKDLASFLNVTSGAITQFIDVLVEKKLVKREEDAKDRRILKISLTEAAQKRFNEFKKDYHKAVSPLFDKLNEDELEQFLYLLDKIKLGR